MNNAQFINTFGFLRYQQNKSYRFTGYNKGGGAPAHYMVRLIKGSAKIRTQTGTIEVVQGEVFYIPKGVRYQSIWKADNKNQLTFEAFGFQNLPVPDGYQYILQKVPCGTAAQQYLQNIAETMEVNCTTVGWLYLFLGQAIRQMVHETKQHDSLVQIATDYMRSHTQFYIADVARHCDVSESTLYGIFKRAYNQTPVEVKQKILCERAEELLTTTNLSVEEISNRLCFSSSSYFRKVFRKYTGKTPLQIRKGSKFQL